MFASAYHIQIIWSSDEGYPLGARLYHVLSGFLCCNISISHHLRELVFETASGKEYERNAHVMELFEMGIIHSILCQTGDDAFHMHIKEVVEGTLFACMVLMTVGTDNRVALFGGIIFYTIKHSCIVMGYQVGNNNSNDPWRFLAKALRKGIGTVVQLLGKLFHFSCHLLSHLMAVSQSS